MQYSVGYQSRSRQLQFDLYKLSGCTKKRTLHCEQNKSALYIKPFKKARDSHNASPLRPCKRLPTKCLEFCALVGLSEASKWGVHLPLGLNAMQDIGLSCAGKCAITPSPSESSLTRTWNIYTQKTHNKATVSWRSYINKSWLLVYLTSQCFRHIAGH